MSARDQQRSITGQIGDEFRANLALTFFMWAFKLDRVHTLKWCRVLVKAEEAAVTRHGSGRGINV